MPITFADVSFCNVGPVMNAIGKHGERKTPRGRCKVSMVSEQDEVYEKALWTNTENTSIYHLLMQRCEEDAEVCRR